MGSGERDPNLGLRNWVEKKKISCGISCVVLVLGMERILLGARPEFSGLWTLGGKQKKKKSCGSSCGVLVVGCDR